MVSWEGVAEGATEFGLVTGASMAAPWILRLNPVTGWGIGAAGLAGGAVSALKSYLYDKKDFNESLNDGLITAGSVMLGGAVMGKLFPSLGKAVGTNAEKKALEEARKLGHQNLSRTHAQIAAAETNLAAAEAKNLPKKIIERRVDDIATLQTQRAGFIADVRTANEGLRLLTPNALGGLGRFATSANPKMLTRAGLAGGAGVGQYVNSLLAPGYTGAFPTKIAATSKDGSFSNGMQALHVPHKQKADEMIKDGLVPPEWAIPPMLAGYLEGRPVA